MADKKISQLNLLTGAAMADNDLIVIVDTSSTETKAVRFDQFYARFDGDIQAYVTAAEAAQAGAEAAEAATLDIFDQFGDQYLGPKASDPTVDNDGDPLTEGDIYFNTTDDVLKFYSGTAWVAPEVIATTAATNASNSASAAASSASAAATSATNSANSASASATSASNSATSASESASSASDSADSATASQNSATQAGTFAANAASSYDQFDDRYLGDKASEPSVDNDGDPLLTGALFFDTTTNTMKVYDGSVWQTAYANAATFLQVANNLSDLNDAGTARTNLDVDQAGTALALAIALG
jgi:autotransporter adhesin